MPLKVFANSFYRTGVAAGKEYYEDYERSKLLSDDSQGMESYPQETYANTLLEHALVTIGGMAVSSVMDWLLMTQERSCKVRESILRIIERSNAPSKTFDEDAIRVLDGPGQEGSVGPGNGRSVAHSLTQKLGYPELRDLSSEEQAGMDGGFVVPSLLALLNSIGAETEMDLKGTALKLDQSNHIARYRIAGHEYDLVHYRARQSNVNLGILFERTGAPGGMLSLLQHSVAWSRNRGEIFIHDSNLDEPMELVQWEKSLVPAYMQSAGATHISDVELTSIHPTSEWDKLTVSHDGGAYAYAQPRVSTVSAASLQRTRRSTYAPSVMRVPARNVASVLMDPQSGSEFHNLETVEGEKRMVGDIIDSVEAAFTLTDRILQVVAKSQQGVK